MPQLDVFHVVRNSVQSLGLVHHLVGGNKDELRVVVDEFLDEPGQATRSTLTRSRVIHFISSLLMLINLSAKIRMSDFEQGRRALSQSLGVTAKSSKYM